MTDTNLLNKKIKDARLSREYLADKLGISLYSLQKKINNNSEFKSQEITTLAKEINLTNEEIIDIFLTSV